MRGSQKARRPTASACSHALVTTVVGSSSTPRIPSVGSIFMAYSGSILQRPDIAAAFAAFHIPVPSDPFSRAAVHADPLREILAVKENPGIGRRLASRFLGARGCWTHNGRQRPAAVVIKPIGIRLAEANCLHRQFCRAKNNKSEAESPCDFDIHRQSFQAWLHRNRTVSSPHARWKGLFRTAQMPTSVTT